MTFSVRFTMFSFFVMAIGWNSLVLGIGLFAPLTWVNYAPLYPQRSRIVLNQFCKGWMIDFYRKPVGHTWIALEVVSWACSWIRLRLLVPLPPWDILDTFLINFLCLNGNLNRFFVHNCFFVSFIDKGKTLKI